MRDLVDYLAERGRRFTVLLFLLGALGGMLLFASGILIATRTQDNAIQTEDNCDSVHGLVVALNQIIADNDARIRRSVRLGVLTPKAARESLAFNARARRKLDAADCQ